MSEIDSFRPLAARMRPQSLDEFVGQQHLFGNNKTLKNSIESGRLHSMVFWGPPGTGKTTLAKIIASTADATFVVLSAVLSGVKDIRKAVESAGNDRQAFNRDTILFVDEVHKFNKAQQDAFLPHIENGTIIFIGATKEIPSFELNNALLSRVRVYVLKTLQTVDVVAVLKNALVNKPRGLGELDLTIDKDAMESLAEFADGDARRALNRLEIITDLAENKKVTNKLVLEIISGAQNRRFDKHGEVFYDQISALHKSVRGSAPRCCTVLVYTYDRCGLRPLLYRSESCSYGI